jgi:hypothetical protein
MKRVEEDQVPRVAGTLAHRRRLGSCCREGVRDKPRRAPLLLDSSSYRWPAIGRFRRGFVERSDGGGRCRLDSANRAYIRMLLSRGLLSSTA